MHEDIGLSFRGFTTFKIKHETSRSDMSGPVFALYGKIDILMVGCEGVNNCPLVGRFEGSNLHPNAFDMLHPRTCPSKITYVQVYFEK